MTGYDRHFITASDGELYDRSEYGSGSYPTVLWEIEKDQLAAAVRRMRRFHEHLDYLDFAVGTGRILRFMEPLVDTATGIDVSEAMIDIASHRVSSSRLICADITSPNAFKEGEYDLITAFRFFLNAEPDLRVRAMTALAARLRDTNSLIVFNNHGNPFSHKLLLLPVWKLRSRSVDLPCGNYMTNRAARQLADAAGLEIVATFGCGILGGRVARILGTERASRIERAASRSTWLQPYCVNQLYFARLRS